MTINDTGVSSRPRQITIRKIHKINAVFLIVFLVLHLATHLSGIFGISTYNSVQSALRLIYGNLLVETVLIVSIVTQLIVGAILLVRSLRRGKPVGFWPWAQVLSGGFFFVFMAQHLYSLWFARVIFDLDTNFYWPASVMTGPPFIYYFIPYYFFGVWAVITHIGVGVRYRVLDAGNKIAADRVGVGIIVAGAFVSALILPILSGVFFEIEMPQEWIDYLRFYDPDFVPW
ncbi:hypothetical protein ACFFUT_12825 [Pseudohalocynthiibacter aestuariivivens]|uniref:Pr6Pr family membrane protein n=1 Tax=Pseudohalocynthiibacter aestuariivivens TaxID=1591409 RepID=A0ABV5JGT3_9RHOB|nr:MULTISPECIES: hypothetical protein [Pseudohalocynthiibacter]MBS9718153.1 hypothetical protein [Pseudohalocynthiibacter aestuariivivens]MCK0103803.1 hypothetical protein [Pseudohalocynthiibacter sp. F2068]